LISGLRVVAYNLVFDFKLFIFIS